MIYFLPFSKSDKLAICVSLFVGRLILGFELIIPFEPPYPLLLVSNVKFID